MGTLPLNQLDAPNPLELDPAVWRRNLAATHATDIELAARLASATLPEHWSPVAALDGAPTWRIEQSGETPIWLDGSSAPRARAEALLRSFRASDANVLVCEVGSGAEVAELIRRLPPLLAVFAFAENIETLAATLRLRDWSTEISNRRIILAEPGVEETRLTERLERESGLNPPTGIIRDTRLAPERLAYGQRVIASLVAHISATREIRLQELKASLRKTPHSAAILALTGPDTADLAESIARGAASAGWRAAAITAKSPADGHPIAAFEKLNGASPEVALAIGHSPTVLDANLGKIRARWMIEPPLECDRGVWHSLTEDDTIWLGASDRIRDTIRRVTGDKIRPEAFYWAVDERTPEATDFADEAMILGALPEDRAAALGITQPTHVAIWDAARAIAEKRWNQPLIHDPNGLMRAAETAADARIGDSTIRARMLHLLEHALIPAAVARRIIDVTQKAGITVSANGAGWNREPDVRRAAPIWRSETSPRAVIFGGRRDAFTRDVLETVARGVPLLMHDPGGSTAPAHTIKEVISTGEMTTFSGGPTLAAAIHTIRQDFRAAQRKAAPARRRVLSAHTWAARWRALTESPSIMTMPADAG